MAGLMDFLGGGMFGGTDAYGSLLTDEMKKKMQQQAMMTMAAKLMQAGAPSRTPTNLGSALGQAYLSGQQAYGQAGQNALAGMLTKQKIDEYNRKVQQQTDWRNLFNPSAPQTAAPQTAAPQTAAPPMPSPVDQALALRGTGAIAATSLPNQFGVTTSPVAPQRMPQAIPLPAAGIQPSPRTQQPQTLGQFVSTLDPVQRALIGQMTPDTGAPALLNMANQRATTLTKDMISQLGLPAGTVAQSLPTGEVKILRTPSDAPASIRELQMTGTPVTLPNLMRLKSSSAVNVNLGDRKIQMGRFENYAKQADVARDLVPELQTLSELAQSAPSGAIQGRLAEAFPGFSTAGDAFQSVISRVAPKMRVPGSGAASDKDVDLLRASLGSLRNTPGANQLIYQAFMDKANLEIERGNISDQVIFGEITPQAGLAKLREMDQRSIISPQLRALLDQLKGGRAVTPSGSNPAAQYFQ